MGLVAKDEFQNRTTFSFHMRSRSSAGPDLGESRVRGSPRRPAEFRCRAPGGDPCSLRLLLSIAPWPRHQNSWTNEVQHRSYESETSGVKCQEATGMCGRQARFRTAGGTSVQANSGGARALCDERKSR
jgi:hypothetical protein